LCPYATNNQVLPFAVRNIYLAQGRARYLLLAQGASKRLKTLDSTRN